MRMDVEFPPPFRSNRKSGTGVPDGHLRPLGFQRKPEGKVKEVTDVPHPKDFSSLHVTKKKPLVLRGAVKDALAFEKWSDNYLEENFGDLKLLIEVKKENRTKTQQNIISFKDFLRGYKREDWYAVTVLPDEMRPHVKVPQCLLCGSFKKLIQESNFWMSSGGTSSVLHYDADHNIHCLLDGRKDFIFIHPKYSKFLEMADKSPDAGSGYSLIDVEMVNMFKYSSFAKVPWTWTTIWPGDCVFIPSGYFHQVRSYGRSMSYAILFTTEPNFNDSDCSDDFPYTSLDQVPVFWTYKKGDKVIEMGFMDPESIRQAFLQILREDDRLSFERFMIFYADFFLDDIEPDLNDEKLRESAMKAFKIFDKRNRGFINRKQILDADVEMFKDVARLLDEPSYDINKNPIHGSHDEL
ncbi:jmjC domain-containing protein D-like isoform X2 [Anneissia japonica]|nr:jmjC domain-containing protein D-like isoform X2 [Anneissia japonica]XP_033110922.1 jmjC domain-containing protein D-like isoform X2 [Anneissia japonica]